MKLKEYFTVAHIVALVSVALGIVYLFDYHSTGDAWEILDTMSSLSMIAGGLIVALMKRPSIYTSAGVLGVSIGLSITFGFIIMVTSTKLVEFILGCTVIVCGVLSAVFAISLYYGNKYNVYRLKIIYLIYVAISLIPLVLNVAVFNVNLFTAMADLKVSLLSFIVVLGYFILLNDPEIRYKSPNGRMNSNLNTIYNTILNDPNAYINREDLISAAAVKEWTPVNEDPIVSENIVPLTVGGKPAMLVLHLWNDGRYFGEIVRSNRGTVIQSLRFEYVDIVIENDDPRTCPDVTIYGKDGVFIRLLVNDDESKFYNKMSKGARILYKIIGY